MKIRIHHPHTHAGIAYTPGPEGVELDVTEQEAAFLRANGLCTPAAAEQVADTAIQPEPVTRPRGRH